LLGLIWDLDGTLIDSREDVLLALEKSVKDVGVSLDQQVNSFKIGPPINLILDSAFPKEVLANGVKEKIISAFRENYDNCDFENTVKVLGIDEVLNNKKYKNFIVTNKPDYATNRIIEKLGWQDVFVEIITPYTFITDSIKKFSKTELFKYLIEKYSCRSFISIGDMMADCLAANENNIVSIGVLWGEGKRFELEHNCSVTVSSVVELKETLYSFYHKIVNENTGDLK